MKCFRGEFIVEEEDWLQCRGIYMVSAMKILSLSANVTDEPRIPRILDFFGYMLCPGTVLFGPWISFEEYANSQQLTKV